MTHFFQFLVTENPDSLKVSAYSEFWSSEYTEGQASRLSLLAFRCCFASLMVKILFFASWRMFLFSSFRLVVMAKGSFEEGFNTCSRLSPVSCRKREVMNPYLRYRRKIRLLSSILSLSCCSNFQKSSNSFFFLKVGHLMMRWFCSQWKQHGCGGSG